MLKTRTHINELETKIALDLVHRYLGIQQLVFSKWRHSLETGSWSSIITINGANIINYIVDDISDSDSISGIICHPKSFHLRPREKKEPIQAVRDIITTDYEQQVEVETHTLAKVSKAKYKLYKYISVWLGALSTILLIPLVYLVFIHNPFKEKMLAADTSFIKVDYNQVINRLEHVKVSKLPYTQKYELAYSYINGMSFSEEQREVILNNVTLKTDELYLDYWINIGRGLDDDAIDAAKRLDDSDLVIYAIVQKMDQVRKDNSLSGKDREQKLSELQTDYDKYWKDRKTALTDEESKSKNSNNHSTNSNKELSSEPSSTTTSTSSKTKSR